MTDSRPKVLYGEANYRAMVKENGYYVDKTHYIPLLEQFKSPVFLRPRRFGKSLLCTTLQYYYDLQFADQFQELFGHTWIGANPTPKQGSFLVVSFDFSAVDPSGSVEAIEKKFNEAINKKLNHFCLINRKLFPEPIIIDRERSGTANLSDLAFTLNAYGLPPLYVIVDEYDNFANQLIVSKKDDLYRTLMEDDSFLKSFFKILKEGRKDGVIAHIFLTGVLPITIDDLASGYNIAEFITLDPRFEAMAGFTQSEVDTLLDRIYADYQLDESTRTQVNEVVKSNYNGYHMVDIDAEPLYNSTILIYFLQKLISFKEIPEFLTDLNLKTDISWIRRLTSSNAERTRELVDQLTIHNRLTYDRQQLRDKFDMKQFFNKTFYPISFFYLGMVTRYNSFQMCLPNLNMKAIFSEYFNELYEIDVSTLYADMMSGFLDKPDLPKLFADYWELYVSQLPEAVFAKVNENFYRTTFYELTKRYLSGYYVWQMESSYPGGRSDLEMEGKFHTRFVGSRYLMEFKYTSNAKSAKVKLASFQPSAADKEQLRRYHDGQCAQYPEQQIQSYLIYCFGNRGFRVFPLEA